MIVKPKGSDHLEIEMFHNVTVSKDNAITNFRQYLYKVLEEFEHELARTVYPAMPPTKSHIIVPD